MHLRVETSNRDAIAAIAASAISTTDGSLLLISFARKASGEYWMTADEGGGEPEPEPIV
jgi:hypothetical protein